MTKLSISLAAVALSITLTPTAQAFSTEPAADTLRQIGQMADVGHQRVSVAGTCTVLITPILASILRLPDDFRGGTQRTTQTALACADQ